MKTPGQIAFEAFNKYDGAKFSEYPKSTAESWEKAAQAVLNSQWRSVDDPPENPKETVLLCGGGKEVRVSTFEGKLPERTYWMRIPKIPKSKDREDFEEWCKKEEPLFSVNKDIAWKAWQAAKATK